MDGVSLEAFERSLEDNLYKLWNRMASGSYVPPPVKAVIIPKKDGGERVLGVPTVADRVAQMVVKMAFEPNVEPVFLAELVWLQAGQVGAGCRAGYPRAVLEVRLGLGVRHQRA